MFNYFILIFFIYHVLGWNRINILLEFITMMPPENSLYFTCKIGHTPW